MRILVTGYKGYVGSYLCHMLKGHEVLGLDVVDGKEGDITAAEGIARAVEFRSEIIFNLAAIVGEPEARKDPRLTRQVNSDAPVHLRSFCPEATFVQASTASVLGPLGSEYPYALSKMHAEMALSMVPASGKLFVLRFATVLGFNPYGKNRWELPANAMVRSACKEGVVRVTGPALLRPWIPVGLLAEVLASITDGWVTEYEAPVPVCAENMCLGRIALEVSRITRASVESSPPGKDARNYTMPALVLRPGAVEEALKAMAVYQMNTQAA